MTPEGKIKEGVKKILKQFTPIDVWWPVTNGMGQSRLDCHICYRGHYIAIETKAPGKKPTPRQEASIANIAKAGGIVLVIDSQEGMGILYKLLQKLSEEPVREPTTVLVNEAQASGCAAPG